MNLVQTIMLPVIAAAVIGAFAWATKRVIGRIDAIGAEMIRMSERLTVVETKQDMAVQTASRTDKVARKTAQKVGVRLPRELTDTIDPTRRAHA